MFIFTVIQNYPDFLSFDVSLSVTGVTELKLIINFQM